MKALALPLIISIFLAGSLAQADLNVLGFQSWKSMRVEEAKAVLEKFQGDMGNERPMAAGNDKSLAAKPLVAKGVVGSKEDTSARVSKGNRNDSKLQQAQLNVEIAQELTVTDYFVLYLNQFKEKEAFLEAAKKLSPEEVAELMMAYKKHLTGANSQSEAQVPSILGGIGHIGSSKPAAQGL